MQAEMKIVKYTYYPSHSGDEIKRDLWRLSVASAITNAINHVGCFWIPRILD
jgi:hypothetical protein